MLYIYVCVAGYPIISRIIAKFVTNAKAQAVLLPTMTAMIGYAIENYVKKTHSLQPCPEEAQAKAGACDSLLPWTAGKPFKNFIDGIIP